ncbi:MAG: carboxypeptidase-like regulatory domain-containing protein [Planctomycetota bacterium]
MLVAVVAVLLTLPLTAQAPTTALVGTVLDPTGIPVPDADIRVSRCDGRLFRCLDLELNREWIEMAQTRTDKAGRFGLQVASGLALRIDVDAPPFARWRSVSCVPGEETTVRLEPPAVATGQLTNAATGKGTPGLLTAWHRHTQVELFCGRTDGDGRFRFDRLPSGDYWCVVEPDEVQAPQWSKHVLEPGGTWTIDLALDPGVELSGTVTDATTGKPIAGARIGEGWTLRKGVESDRDGRYVMRGYGEAGQSQKVDLCCRAPGYPRVSRRDIPPGEGPRRVDIALEPGVRVVGQVVDPDGKPIAKAYVAAITSTGTTVPWQATRTAADGTFVCDGFPRGSEGVLMIRCFGHASAVYYLPRPAADGQIDFGKVALAKPNLVRGFVHNVDGTPAVNAEVQLLGVNHDADRLAQLPSGWWLLRNYAGERQVRTDANGAFAFGDVAPGEYGIGATNGIGLLPDVADVLVERGKEVPLLRLSR